MDDNLNKLKQQWQQLSDRNKSLNEANLRLAEKLAHKATTSLQERLSQRVSRTGWIALLIPLISPLLYFELNMPWWVAVLYAVFGILMSWKAFSFSLYIQDSYLIDLPVADAIKRASDIKIRLNRNEFLGIVLGFILLCIMALTIPDGPEHTAIIVGGTIGLVIGSAIGIRLYMSNMRIARDLLRSLKANDTND